MKRSKCPIPAFLVLILILTAFAFRLPAAGQGSVADHPRVEQFRKERGG